MQPLLLIAAGGTGGHVFPGLAVAEEMRARRTDVQVEFVGSTAPLGLERRIVPQAGLPLHLLPVLPLNTSSLKARVRGLALLPWGLLKAFALLIRRRPRAVLGIGGYASGPLVLMASLLRIPTVLLEPNAVPGFTNRMLKPFVQQAACAFPSTLPHFGGKGVLTGNPVRAAFHSVAASDHAPPFELLCFGGSQGSRVLSQALVAALPRLPGENSLSIVHQTGPAQLSEIEARYRAAGRSARVTAFIDDMPGAFASADIVLCRAGATTVAEVCAAGKAAVLVPLATAADDHQTANARAMADLDAAVLVAEKDLGDVAGVISGLVAAPDRIAVLEANARKLGRTDAAARVADLLEPWMEAA